MLSRKLSALGYSIGQTLNHRGVEAICLTNPRGDCLLLVSSVFYGPSWVQIFKSLEHLVPAPTLITLGVTPAVLIADSSLARDLVGTLFEEYIASRGKQVHLEGIGFVELEGKPRPDLKPLALPMLSILCVVVLGVFWGSSQQTRQAVDVDPVADSCVVDFRQAEFESWLSQTLESESALSGVLELQKQTNVGQLDIVVESIIGSAAKVTGVAVCSDGRQRAINHRIDTSGEGAVFELGS